MNNSEGLKALLLFIDNRISELNNKFEVLAQNCVFAFNDESRTAALTCHGRLQGLRELRSDIQRLVNEG